MKYLLINSVCGIRSTGRICTDIADSLIELGHEVKIAYGRGNVPKKYEKYAIRINNDVDSMIHCIKSRLYDASGFGSKLATKKFINWIKKYDPDVINIHNIHGYYINVEILFDYLKKCGKPIIWTLHDCWSFTGHCPYFEYANCDKWESGCNKCPQIKEYPKSFIDLSKRNWKIKKNIFTNVPNMHLVTPSQWLADLVTKSFLKNYHVTVIHNNVDRNIFHFTENNLKIEYGIENKKVILGVAAEWNYRKGLVYMEELSKLLNNEYVVVVIGVSKEQKACLPKNMIGITHTSSAIELAKWYSVAEVYINPTLEDNYPTTNLESIACGTPVITFDAGGSKESACLFGKVVEKGDLNEVCRIIYNADYEKNKVKNSTLGMVEQYLELFGKINN